MFRYCRVLKYVIAFARRDYTTADIKDIGNVNWRRNQIPRVKTSLNCALFLEVSSIKPVLIVCDFYDLKFSRAMVIQQFTVFAVIISH